MLLLKNIVQIKLLCFVIFHYAEAYQRIDPLVHTEIGLIRGVKASDGDYTMFMGIPFGKVDPSNPFSPATPYPPFEEIFDANDDSAICPQIEEINNTIVGAVDCLHLNVYVPNSASHKNRLPVLVWIYGGGFSIGFAGRNIYGPKYLVKHDVILVTLNYRLGPYGFMCLNTREVPGNQGLKDQLMALRWINDHIESFGGDANKITIFGESAGGFSVDLHLYSKQEKLFNRAILQSGTALLPGLYTESNSELLLQLANQLGLDTDDVNEALSFVSSKDPKLVIAAASKVDRFTPCIEKEHENVENFLVEYPFNSYIIPKAKGMSILIGFNAEESLGGYDNKNTDFYTKWNGFYEFLNKNFDFDENVRGNITDILRQYYIGDEIINEAVKFNLSNFESDGSYNYPTEKTIAKYIENGAEGVFQYVFSYVGHRNWARRFKNITIKGGAVHADEIGYLFDISHFAENPKKADQHVIDVITTLWTNFVKFGDPTPATTDLLPVKWEPITDKDSVHYYLDIDSELNIGKRPYHERLAFWELFYYQNKRFLKGYKAPNK